MGALDVALKQERKMMNTEQDGGPAFPQLCGADTVGTNEGMSLRDWFAGQALVGILGNSELFNSLSNALDSQPGCDTLEHVMSAVALMATQQADAMLKARNTPPAPDRRS
jgi:hypothetical protein